MTDTSLLLSALLMTTAVVPLSAADPAQPPVDPSSSAGPSATPPGPESSSTSPSTIETAPAQPPADSNRDEAPNTASEPPAPARRPVRVRARPAPEPVTTEPIEVTATQSERPVDESPVPVYVIQRRELERSGSLDLSQALGTAPGVTVSITENSARGGGPGVAIQGLDSKQVLVLLNGRPFVGDSDGAVDVTAIPVSILERIEIVAGPMAVLYGGGAVGGVINLITHQAAPGAGGPHLSTNARYGSYNTLDASQALSYGASTMSALLVGNFSSSDGFDLDPTFADTNGERYRRSSLFASFDWRPRPELDLRLDTLYQSSDRLRVYLDSRYIDTIGKYYFHDWTWDEQRLFSTLSFGWSRPKMALTGWLSASLYRRDYADQIQGALAQEERDTETHDVNGRVQASWTPSPTLVIFGGVEARTQDLSIYSGGLGEEGEPLPYEAETALQRMTQLEAFALVDKFFFNERLEVYAGARLHYNSFQNEFFPPWLLNVRWKPIDLLTLRGNFGMGYRPPNLKELFYQLDHSAFGYVILGNQDLVAEKSLTANLSAELDLDRRGFLRAGVFFHDIVNLIDFSQLPDLDEDGNLQFQLLNIAAAVNQGVEAIGSTELGPVSLTAAYQFLDAREKETGLHLLYRSAHTAKLNATWRLGDSGVELTGVARYQSPQYVYDDADFEGGACDPTAYADRLGGGGWDYAAIGAIEDECYLRSSGFAVLDARAQARFQLPTGPLTLVFYGGVNNLTNVKREPSSLTTENPSENQTLDVRPQPGRVFFLGLKGDI